MPQSCAPLILKPVLHRPQEDTSLEVAVYYLKHEAARGSERAVHGFRGSFWLHTVETHDFANARKEIFGGLLLQISGHAGCCHYPGKALDVPAPGSHHSGNSGGDLYMVRVYVYVYIHI